ncbi:MAG: DMT family transporter [Proteobacteria bacterium]|nr:DMT family transporter [Pseudomonadota bacterium]
MNPAILAIVLLAALLHALWNGLVKASGDRTATLGLISAGHVLLGVTLAMFVPVPDSASWPYIAASTFIHFGYYFMLNRSYLLGDLSVVYPIARGIAPLLVALGAVAVADEYLPVWVWGGIAAISGGILLLSLQSLRKNPSPAMILTALTTGVCIAAYSLVDGLGVRVSQSPLGYIAWLFIMEILVAAFIFHRRGRDMFRLPRNALLFGILGGLISATAYGLVIYAKSLALLGAVSALRETSVLFAALIGVVLLGERPWRLRLFAAGIVVIGVILVVQA